MLVSDGRASQSLRSDWDVLGDVQRGQLDLRQLDAAEFGHRIWSVAWGALSSDIPVWTFFCGQIRETDRQIISLRVATGASLLHNDNSCTARSFSRKLKQKHCCKLARHKCGVS